MQAPIIVVEKSGEIQIFESVSEAESFIEPIDARNGEYSVYDADGYELDTAIERARGLLKPELVKLVSTNRIDSKKLKICLISYLNHLGENINSDSLSDLINQLKIYLNNIKRDRLG